MLALDSPGLPSSQSIKGIQSLVRGGVTHHPALTLRVVTDSLREENQSHACKQVATGRSNPDPTTLAMINHLPMRRSTQLANTVHSVPPPGANA